MPRTLLLAALIALVCVQARAAEITVVVQYMQRSVVIERCSDQGIADEIERQLRAQMGCIRMLPAVDNPNDIWCLMYIGLHLSIEDQFNTERRLRRLCEAPHE